MIDPHHRPERLLPAHRQNGHRQLDPLGDLVVLGILSKGGELGKSSAHRPRLRIQRGIVGPSGLVDLGRIGRKLVPETIEKNPLPALHQPLGVRAAKREMPEEGIAQQFVPRIDTRNRRVHQHQPIHLVPISCGVGVHHHVADVVRDDNGAVVSKSRDHGPNVPGLCLFVVARGGS